MNGEQAQLVALTWHANAAIAGTPAPFADDLTARMCQSIRFVVMRRSALGMFKEVPVAATPDAWFARLRHNGVTGVQLAFAPDEDAGLPDRVTSGFVGGGGDWRLLALLADGTCEHWIARWEMGNQRAPDDRIWRVTYGLAGTAPIAPPRPPSFADVLARFTTALVNIRAFSERNDCGNFTNCFQSALDCLADPDACIGDDRSPTLNGVVPPQALALLSAASSAWVFGGMGSWNDMAFDGATDVEYRKVSGDLFATLREAIVAAANGSLPDSALR